MKLIDRTFVAVKDKEEFVGKVYAFKHPYVNELTFCFTELPRYFLSLTNLMDYRFTVEGVPKNLYGSAEKILLKNFYNVKPRIFSLFTIYDQLGEFTLENLVSRRVLFENSQWEKCEATIVDGRENLKWLYLLLLYSQYYDPPWKPTVVTENFKNVFSSGAVFIAARPSLWKLEENMHLFKTIASKLRSSLMFLPRRFFITFKLNSKENLQRLVEYSNMIFQGGSSLKGYLKLHMREVSKLKSAVAEAGYLYSEVIGRLLKFTERSDKTIVTTFVKSMGRQPYEVFTAISSGNVIFERKICQRFPYSLIFGRGEKPKALKLKDEKYMLISNMEEIDYQGKAIIFGGSFKLTGRKSVVFDVSPREMPISNVNAVNLKVYLSSKLIGLCGSRRNYTWINL